MKKILAALLLLAAIGNGQAQPDSLSRWMIGIKGDIVLDADCGFCDFSRNTTHLAPFSVEAEYRPLRWLSFPMQAGFWSLNDKGMAYTSTIGEESAFGIYDLSFRSWAWSVSGGPRFMLRIGQGDLGLSFRAGLTVQHLEQRLRNLDEPELLIEYQPRISPLMALELGYTYWMQPRLAVRVSLETTSVRGDRLYEPKSSLPKLIPAGQIDYYLSANKFRGQYGPEWASLSFGIFYRL